jgi:hypothetical protein
MDRDREKEAIVRQLSRLLALSKDFSKGITADNIRKLEDELTERLRSLSDQ